MRAVLAAAFVAAFPRPSTPACLRQAYAQDERSGAQRAQAQDERSGAQRAQAQEERSGAQRAQAQEERSGAQWAQAQDERPGVQRTQPRPDPARELRPPAGHRVAAPRAISHYLEARRRLREGDPDGAAVALRIAIDFDPVSPELRVALARALLELGRLDAAAAEAHEALSLGGSGATAVEAHVLAARVHLARRQQDAALTALGQACRIAGRLEEPPAEPWRLLAEVHADAGRFEAAERALDELAPLVPAEAAAGHRELGRRALDCAASAEPPPPCEDAGRAEVHLRRATALDPGDPEALRLLAAAYEALRRPHEAREAHLAALRLDPDDGAALLALGRLALAEGDVAEAREWFRRHVRAAPDPADAYVRVAFQWLGDTRPDEALGAARAGLAEAGPDPRLRLAEGLALRALRRFAEAAVALAPVPPAAGEIWLPARVALGECLSRAGRHEEAERVFREALAARPGDLRLLSAGARARVRAGRAAEAVEGLRAAVARAPEEEAPALLEALADALVEAGRAGEAIAVLREGLEERPRDGELAYALAVTLERAGQVEASLAQLGALLVLEPDHAEAMNAVAYTLAGQGTRLDEAERQVRRALALAPRAGHMYDTLGWVLFRRGELEGAAAALERALALGGPDPTVLEHLADVRRAQGRREDARALLGRALAERGDAGPGEEARRRAGVERKLRALGAPPRPVSLTRDTRGR